MSRFCPDVCPLCGSDLKDDGYPIAHQHAETGEICEFEWDTRAALEHELDEEAEEARRAG